MSACKVSPEAIFNGPCGVLFESTLKSLLGLLLIIILPFTNHVALADHGAETWSSAAPSVVVIEPTWPGYSRPGFGAPPGTAPAGTGFYIGSGERSRYLVTAAHVIARATDIDIVTEKAERHPATIVAVDIQRDIAVLRTDLERRPISLRPSDPAVGEHACAIGNSFGLGLGISCGVVSAIHRTDVGFNAIEDFVQTDAAINPGGSGGALVDAKGRLIGMIDGIFTKEADIDAGVNFAVSVPLLIESIGLQRRSDPEIPPLR